MPVATSRSAPRWRATACPRRACSSPPRPARGGRSLAFGASLEGGRSGEVLFAVGGQGVQPRVHSGQRVGRKGRVVDLFSSPLDDLAHASLSGGCMAFQAALSGVGGATG